MKAEGIGVGEVGSQQGYMPVSNGSSTDAFKPTFPYSDQASACGDCDRMI